MRKIILITFTICLFFKVNSQINTLALNGQTINPITTAVPFLSIGPDSKQGAMGDVGAATDPDINSIHWNGSKLAFQENKFGMGFTATPWLKNLVPDIYLFYLAGYYKVAKNTTVGSSLRYFSLGNIDFTDAVGNNTGSDRPNEFAVDGCVAQKLSKNFSMSVTMRFIYSGISRAYFNGQGNAASTGAVDISGFYKSNKFSLGDKKAIATGGFAFTNLGAKIKYSNDQNFIPMNLRLGGGLKTIIDDANTFGFYLDFNKLLVPTPPIYQYGSDGKISIDPATNKKVILKGKDPNVPVAQGIFQSFGDAPGGFKEEMQEINICTGLEYWYNNAFAARTGFFYEPKTKGSRQYFTLGVGFRFSYINIDGSYLIPILNNNPLQNTWRLSFSFDFGSKKPDAAPATTP